ncbi:MAG: 3-oxoacyl-ACP reductase [Candidatus Omnitrophica bacterium CG11_big_fil_rev_8_21_14_0_20_42_13]|uniref:3-oxoacyl-[acyl-carrier-protein] reductase n=1 Tax=Candidatus Ghiorseimicrobium undicola TaxID=1974746 RepID=A0A2H0LVX8_9BACT|nr:MAG: 3-oxoacyl-ACP reductase [Candidatus Omnitrophica bacterium CG11_big_fil_rev_8_21_14_0_20_42_13]
MRLKDKVALITGGGRGIGREIALFFAKEGADIAICDVNIESAEDTAREVEKTGRKAAGFKADVTSFASAEDLVNKTLDKFNKIDILVNNAGITRDGLMLRMSEADWDAVINVNLKGTFNASKVVSKIMVKQRQGKIVNIASIIGLIGNIGQANYAASKAGIIGLTKSMAKELALRNICVNAVAPGFIQTDMTAKLPEDVKERMLKSIPLGKFGTALDVAKTCLFLASGESDYITGQVIVVDGGMVM